MTARNEADMKRNCCTGLTRLEDDSNAPVLTMGAYGTPKCLCEHCASLVETITLGRDYDEITSAMEAITAKMSASNVDDRATVTAMTDLLAASAERAQQIKDGTYDFSLDEESADEDSFDEIPEELRETEEDKELDKKDEEAMKKFDKVLNILWIIVGIFALGIIAWRIIQGFI